MLPTGSAEAGRCSPPLPCAGQSRPGTDRSRLKIQNGKRLLSKLWKYYYDLALKPLPIESAAGLVEGGVDGLHKVDHGQLTGSKWIKSTNRIKSWFLPVPNLHGNYRPTGWKLVYCAFSLAISVTFVFWKLTRNIQKNVYRFNWMNSQVHLHDDSVLYDLVSLQLPDDGVDKLKRRLQRRLPKLNRLLQQRYVDFSLFDFWPILSRQ